jgi:integrase
VILGLETGSRSGVLLSLQWDWIDLKRGVMVRRAPGEAESKKRTPPVRLGKSLVRLLQLWKRQDKGIKFICHYEGAQIKKLRRSWAAACRAAKIKGATAHAGDDVDAGRRRSLGGCGPPGDVS